MFFKRKFKEIEHAIDENIDNANDAHVRINETKVEIQKEFNEINERFETNDFNLQDLHNKLDELEKKVKTKWEKLTKRVETCEKANEMFIKALNEQRDVIIKIVNALNKSLKTSTPTTKKKGK